MLNPKIISLPTFTDDRGILTVMHAMKDIPIEIRRVFYIYKSNQPRGGHAHAKSDQLIIAVAGSFNIRLSTPDTQEVFFMDDPGKALYIPRMHFIEMYDFSPDAVLLTLTNTDFDASEYLHWDEYIELFSNPTANC